MIIRGTHFRFAFDQSGVRNFDGKGYPYHDYFGPWKPTFKHSSFVAKTTTLNSRLGKEYNEGGNMPLEQDGMTPKELKPACIHVSLRSFLRGAALNAVGFSGPGLSPLLQKGIWYQFREPFMISVMTLAPTRWERLAELERIVSLVVRYLPFHVPFGVQLDISCPNVDNEEQETAEIVCETRESLAILRHLGDDVALVPKINARFPISAAIEICEDDNCDGVCNSNTISWNDLPESERKRLFGTTVSPLARYGGGGVSGSYLLPKVLSWVRTAREKGLAKPIIAGGGILRVRHVDDLAEAGASAIAVGSAAFLRPWRVQKIIDRANQLGSFGGFYEAQSRF